MVLVRYCAYCALGTCISCIGYILHEHITCVRDNLEAHCTSNVIAVCSISTLECLYIQL